MTVPALIRYLRIKQYKYTRHLNTPSHFVLFATGTPYYYKSNSSGQLSIYSSGNWNVGDDIIGRSWMRTTRVGPLNGAV